MRLSEHEIAKVSTEIGRSCGGCTLCCTLLRVDELDKPALIPCKHECSKGCAIYEDRPPVCRNFTCAWLVNKSIPDHWYPHTSQMVIDFALPKFGEPLMRIHVHPATPKRWAEEPFAADIAKWKAENRIMIFSEAA